MGVPTAPFTVELSALPGTVDWVRAFAGAVAAAHGAPPDDVADVKLATAELAGAIAASNPGGSLALSASVSGQRLSFSIGPWEGEEDPPEDELTSWEIVGALFDDAVIDGDQAVFGLPLG